MNPEEQALQQRTAALDARDARAFAALFEPHADFGDYGGLLLQGRAAIEQHYAEHVFPQLPPTHRHRTRIRYTRLVTPDVIAGDAEVDIYTPDDGVLYVVPAVGVFVRREGQWYFSTVRLLPPCGCAA